MWPRLIHSFQAFALAILLSSSSPGAHADSGTVAAIKGQTGSPYHMIICGESGTFDLDVNWRTGTMIQVPDGIKKRAWPDTPEFNFDKKKKRDRVYFAPAQTTPEGTETSLRVWLSSGWEATIHANAVEQTRGIEDNVLLYHQSEREKLGLAHLPNPCEPRPERARDRLIARAAARHGQERVTRALPVIDHVSKSGHSLDVSILQAEWEGKDMVVDFEAENRDFQPSRLTRIEVLDEYGEPLDAELVYPRPAQSEDAQELTIVHGHQSTTGSILLPDALSRNVGSMEIRFHGMKGASPYFTAVKVVRFRPVTEEETKREQRAKQVTVSVRGIYGGFWTDDAAGQNMIDGTTVAGVGVRLTKGIFPLLAFEGEFAGGRTGGAQFTGIDWGGMQGNVTRSASFGRLQAAGVVRFGDQYTVSTRLGVGVQLASFDSTMNAGGSPVVGPGDGLEIDGLWSVGAGFDTRLGKHWILGAGLNFSSTWSAGAKLFETGLHVGYGWGGSDGD